MFNVYNSWVSCIFHFLLLVLQISTNFKQHGDIQLIIGPMYSGKSTELIRRQRRYTAARQKCLQVKFSGDTRYSNEKMSTHDMVQLEAYSANRLVEIDPIVQERQPDVITVDEGQFFPDVEIYAEKWANQGKTVIISALSGDFRRKPFENIKNLISLADQVETLQAVCYYCSESAPFSLRIKGGKEQVQIGGKDEYVAVCRKCWNKHYTEDLE